MSYVNKKYTGNKDTVYEDEDWAELVSPSERGVGPMDPSKNPKDHRGLTHREAPDQHPMSAITGLIDALAQKVDNDSISAERTSEGTVITIGDKVIVIYDNPSTGVVNSITINGNPVPIDDFGNASIDTSTIDVTNSIIRIETPESSTVTTVGAIVELILREISEIPRIIFRTWPGLQEGN